MRAGLAAAPFFSITGLRALHPWAWCPSGAANAEKHPPAGRCREASALIDHPLEIRMVSGRAKLLIRPPQSLAGQVA
jgi:hypothetical protein